MNSDIGLDDLDFHSSVAVHFLANLSMDLVDVQNVATTCWFFLKLMKGREFCWHDFMKYMFDIIICQDTCESICFKFVMMLNTTELNSLIPV